MEDEMANYPGLTQRGGVWQVRKRIPADLQHIDTRGSIRISLETRDKREAIGRYHLKLAEIEAGFSRLRDELRSRPFIETALATARIQDLGRSAIEALVRQWWSGRVPYREPTGRDGQETAEVLAMLADDEAEMMRAESEGRDLAGELTDRMLVDAGMASRPRRLGRITTQVPYPAVDRDTLAYSQLRALVRQGLAHEAVLSRDYVTGEHTAPPHPIFNPEGVGTLNTNKTIADLVRDYRSERERLYGVESTARKFGLLFRVIEEQWSQDLPVAEITRQNCVDLVGFIQKLPVNGTKKFPKLTLAQSVAAAEAGGYKVLAPNTVGSYVQNLCAVLRWGKNHDYGVRVNTDGLKPTGGAETQRRGMTPGELAAIFRGLATCRETTPHKFWIPALAAYTGARAEELCQLRTEDVIEVDGIICLNLTRFDPTGRAVAEKRFKTKYSERYVPLHVEILAAGFMDFVATCDGVGRLFPALKQGKKGNYSHNFSKWYGRFMDSIGLSDPALVFHSYRHGFRDACRDADIPEETAHALGGWATVNQGQRYGNRGAVPNLHRALAKIGYGEFTLIGIAGDCQ
jgi:integrase